MMNLIFFLFFIFVANYLYFFLLLSFFIANSFLFSLWKCILKFVYEEIKVLMHSPLHLIKFLKLHLIKFATLNVHEVKLMA